MARFSHSIPISVMYRNQKVKSESRKTMKRFVSRKHSRILSRISVHVVNSETFSRGYAAFRKQNSLYLQCKAMYQNNMGQMDSNYRSHRKYFMMMLIQGSHEGFSQIRMVFSTFVFPSVFFDHMSKLYDELALLILLTRLVCLFILPAKSRFTTITVYVCHSMKAR